MGDFVYSAGDLFLDLINTRPKGADRDGLRTTDDLVRWLAGVGWVRANARWNDKADPLLPRVKRLRETVRQQVEASTAGQPVSPDVLRTLEAAATDAPAPADIKSAEHLFSLLSKAALTLLSKPPAGLRRQASAAGELWIYQPS